MKFGMIAAVALVAASGSANAAVITQTFNTAGFPGYILTDITTQGTGTFNYWQTVAPANSVLLGVKMRVTVTERLTGLSITNTDPNNPHMFHYQTSSKILLVGNGPVADRVLLKSAIDLNALLMGNVLDTIDLFDTTPTNFLAGETKIFVPPVVTESADSSSINAANIAAYDQLGQFTLGFTTTTSQAFVGGGGNANVQQATDARGTVELDYIYELIPSPGSAAILGLGGLIAARRRRV